MALAVPFFNTICSQVTLGTVNLPQPSKPANVHGVFLIPCCTLWPKFGQITQKLEEALLQSKLSICKRRSGLQTAAAHRPAANSTYKATFHLFWLRLVWFSSAAHADIYLPAQTAEPLALGWGAHVLQHRAHRLRQQLYFCPFNE